MIKRKLTETEKRILITKRLSNFKAEQAAIARKNMRAGSTTFAEICNQFSVQIDYNPRYLDCN